MSYRRGVIDAELSMMMMRLSIMLRRDSPAGLGVIAAAFATALVIGVAACSKPPPAAPPPIPQVAVTKVIRKDVPIYSNWVGTTVGFVNAQIHPQVSGYMLKQVYKDGDHVRARGSCCSRLTIASTRRRFDQALGDLAKSRPNSRKTNRTLPAISRCSLDK